MEEETLEGELVEKEDPKEEPVEEDDPEEEPVKKEDPKEEPVAWGIVAGDEDLEETALDQGPEEMPIEEPDIEEVLATEVEPGLNLLIRSGEAVVGYVGVPAHQMLLGSRCYVIAES